MYRVKLDSSIHRSTGNTDYYRDDELIEVLPSCLQIEDNLQVKNEFYLIYCNENGNDIADTLHDSIDDAMLQAEWEFVVKK